jgi:hypothetical protein
VNWNSIFERRPDLAPPGYHEAVADAKVISEVRYEKFGRKRAKGSNARKPLHESRQSADARRTRFSSMKHASQD